MAQGNFLLVIINAGFYLTSLNLLLIGTIRIQLLFILQAAISGALIALQLKFLTQSRNSLNI